MGDEDKMEAERRVANLTAQTVVDRLMEAATDKKTVEKIMDVWGGEIDRTIGRGLRRAMWYVLIALVGVASVKFGLLEKLVAFLRG